MRITALAGLAALSSWAVASSQEPYEIPPSRCFVDEEVALAYRDGANDIALAGTLSTPAGRDHLGTVLMITGSGPHTRDQMISGVPHFGLIADLLARAGFRVLRTDERGYGASTIDGETLEPDDWDTRTLADRERDNAEWIDYLLSRRETAGQPLIVLGHSEGAMIATRLAGDDPRIGHLVMVSNSTLPGRIVRARQFSGHLRNVGFEEDFVETHESLLIRLGEHFAENPNDEAEYERIATAFMEMQEGLDRPLCNRACFDNMRDTAWVRAFMAHDPYDELTRLRTPVTAFYGSADELTPPHQHLPILVEALAAAGQDDLTVYLLPGQDHFFLEFEGEPVSRHPYGQTRLSNEFSEALLAELSRRFGRLNVCEG